ncbi:MAG: 5-(carboxyamino)imidazole ribonucleotide synthase [Wenzhouxiangella sp.]
MKVGILGGGQLARMMIAAGRPMGLDFLVLDPASGVCAADYAPHVQTDWQAAASEPRLLDCDVITCDFENVPAAVLAQLAAHKPVYPGPQAFAAGQDRLDEKQLLDSLDIPLPGFSEVNARPDLLAAVERLGYPCVLKTRRLGYDGKGQKVLRTHEDLEPAWQTLGGQPLVLEAWVDYTHECALTAVRSRDGEIRHYAPSWTVHADGILKLALAPAPMAEATLAAGRAMVERLMNHLDYVGVLTLEMFHTPDGLLANEFAPRPHNSAHWTIEACICSQFENHLRAVCGLPLGATDSRQPALMFNWIGSLPSREAFLALPDLHWHDYGKTARAGRKIGHATWLVSNLAEFRSAQSDVRSLLEPQLATLFDRLLDDTA